MFIGVLYKSFQSENVYYKSQEKKTHTFGMHLKATTTCLKGGPAAVLKANATAWCADALEPVQCAPWRSVSLLAVPT